MGKENELRGGLVISEFSNFEKEKNLKNELWGWKWSPTRYWVWGRLE